MWHINSFWLSIDYLFFHYRNATSKNNTKMVSNLPSKFWVIQNSPSMVKLYQWKVWHWIVLVARKKPMIMFAEVFGTIWNPTCVGMSMVFYSDQTKNMMKQLNVIAMLSNGSRKTFKFFVTCRYFKYRCVIWKGIRWVDITGLFVICHCTAMSTKTKQLMKLLAMQ